jgi:hypothetical protein
MHREHERCKAEYAGNESIKFLKGNGLLPENSGWRTLRKRSKSTHGSGLF